MFVAVIKFDNRLPPFYEDRILCSLEYLVWYPLTSQINPRQHREISKQLLAGLAVRSIVTDAPLGSFHVEVRSCEGRGDYSSVCMVNVFETDSQGRCAVANEELCFGCMACVAQCLDHGVTIATNDHNDYLSVDELLK